jgi:transposase
MPEAIVTRILRLPGYGVYRHVFDEAAQTVTCWVRPTAPAPYCCCPTCGISTQATAGDPTERRVRDLPWGPWQVWLVVEIQTVVCRRCGRHRERVPFLVGKAHHTVWGEAAVAQACTSAPVATGRRPVGPGGGDGPPDR